MKPYYQILKIKVKGLTKIRWSVVKTILLKLSGPLQAWGTSSHFETRNTDYYPSKSGVIGILAASLGYKRCEDTKIQKLNMLDFAIRTDQTGGLLRDFHTAAKYEQLANGCGRCAEFNKTYTTYRYYMEDSVFVVALSHADNQWIDQIIYALKHPCFPPYMGRRSCPLPADFMLSTSDEDALSALRNVEWQAAAWYKAKHQNYRAEIYADKDLIPHGRAIMRNDHVVSFSQWERKYSPRFEARTDQELSSSNNSKLCANEPDFYESI